MNRCTSDSTHLNRVTSRQSALESIWPRRVTRVRRDDDVRCSSFLDTWPEKGERTDFVSPVRAAGHAELLRGFHRFLGRRALHDEEAEELLFRFGEGSIHDDRRTSLTQGLRGPGRRQPRDRTEAALLLPSVLDGTELRHCLVVL